MPADSATLAARIVEAAASAAWNAYCDDAPCHPQADLGPVARAALAAAVREAGCPPEQLRAIAAAWDHGEPFGDWLRALAWIGS